MRRSPSRRSPPPPPRISRRSPSGSMGFRPRGKSPERRRRMVPPSAGAPKFTPPPGRGGSPSRGRERREFRHSPRRRSRSPLHREKARSFSPSKRKLSPKRERERERTRSRASERVRSREMPGEERERLGAPSRPKRVRTKSPEPAPGMARGSYGPPEGSPVRSYHGSTSNYPIGPGGDDHGNRGSTTLSERFPGPKGPGSVKRESDLPVFRGPEGSGFDVSDLKKITVDIKQNIFSLDSDPIERRIIRPEDVLLVRRPEMPPDDRDYGMMHREGPLLHSRYENDIMPPPSSRISSWERETNHYIHSTNKREGSRPIFARDEILQASRTGSGSIDEVRRVVAIVDEPTSSLQQSVTTKFESPPPRYSPEPRARSREYYPHPSREREPPTRDYPPKDYERTRRAPSYEPRERSRDEHFEGRNEDLRHELDLRRRDELRYPSQERRRYEYSPDRGSSDLRTRIIEKRTDRHDDRDSSHRHMMERRPHSMERRPHSMERERGHREMMQPSPPGSERRRGPPPLPGDGFVRPMGDSKMRRMSPEHVMHGPPPHHREGPPPERFQEPPDFPKHDNKFHYNKNWNPNPEFVPKGRGYFEHDNRETDFVVRGRGRGEFRGRGIMRGRGTIRGRGSFRGGPPTRPSRVFMGRRGGFTPSKSGSDRTGPQRERRFSESENQGSYHRSEKGWQ